MGKALGITLEEARQIIAAATKKANEINVMMNIAVVDAGRQPGGLRAHGRSLDRQHRHRAKEGFYGACL